MDPSHYHVNPLPQPPSKFDFGSRSVVELPVWWKGELTPPPTIESGVFDLLKKRPGVDGTRKMDVLAIEPNDWLRFGSDHRQFIEMRRNVLRDLPDMTVGFLPGSEPHALELAHNVAAYLSAVRPVQFNYRAGVLTQGEDSPWDVASADALSALRQLGTLASEDFFLLLKDAESGHYRLSACVTCFPSNWSPVAELGNSVFTMHESVPGMNEAVGAKIDKFLDRIPKHKIFERTNFLLFSSPTYAYFPGAENVVKRYPSEGLTAENVGASLVIRSERETFIRLPVGGAVVFAIKTTIVQFDQLEREDARHIGRLIEALPPGYVEEKKGFTPQEQSIIHDYLRGA